MTLGPKTKTEVVVTHAGKPMKALANQKIRGQVLDTPHDPIEQDCGGWIFMPPDHWDFVQKELDKVAALKERIAKLEEQLAKNLSK